MFQKDTLAAEWLMNGNGKGRSRGMDWGAISDS